MRIFCKYHICNKSATTWHHVQIHKKATSLQHIGNRWLRGICSPATGAKIYAKTFICLYAKMAKMSDFSNHNILANKTRRLYKCNLTLLYVIYKYTFTKPSFAGCTSECYSTLLLKLRTRQDAASKFITRFIKARVGSSEVIVVRYCSELQF